jgi:hypothetical protein
LPELARQAVLELLTARLLEQVPDAAAMAAQQERRRSPAMGAKECLQSAQV